MRLLPPFGGCSQSLPKRVQTLKNGRPPRPHSGIWHVAAPWIQCPTSRVKTEESDKARILADSQNIWRKIWEILPLQNSNKKPRNNKEKPRKTNEKLRKTYFLLFFLIFLCVDPCKLAKPRDRPHAQVAARHMRGRRPQPQPGHWIATGPYRAY